MRAPAAGAVPVEFETFVRAESAGLLRTAFLLTGNAVASEDVLQETFLRLYPRWNRVAGARQPRAYVRRSLLNTYLNGIRTRSSTEIASAEIWDRPGRADTEQLVSDRDAVVRLLARLPERQRAAVVLRYFDDLSDRDIARALGCRLGTARSLVSRGLALMRSDFQRGHEDV